MSQILKGFDLLCAAIYNRTLQRSQFFPVRLRKLFGNYVN